jgi:trigger factor
MTGTDTKPSETLDVAVEEREAWKRRLTVTVDASRVARERSKERRKLSKKLRLKGFRAGKVPIDIVEQRYGDLVDQRTVQRLVEAAYREAMLSERLDPVGAPEFGQVRYSQGENLTFQVDVEIMPTLKLGRTGGFKISRSQTEVSDDDVKGVLQRLREERGVWEPRESVPEEGDLVAIRITNLEGDDETVSGGSEASDEASEGELYRFPLGSGYAIEDVEKAIETLAPGESGTFTAHFPEDFSDTELAGRTRELRIALVEAKRRRLAELDDQFASDVGEFETIADLRKQIRSDLERHREEEAEQRLRDEITDSIIEANPFDVPGSLVEAYLDRILGGGGEDTSAEEAGSRTEAKESVRPIAEQQLKRELVLEQLIEDLEIEATDEMVDAHITEVAERRELDAKEVRRQLLSKGGLESVQRRVVIEAVYAHLKELSAVE